MIDTFSVADWLPDVEEDPEIAELERLRAIDPSPLVKMINEFWDGTPEARAQAEKSRRYYNNDQIFGETERAWKRSRQPKVIRNEIAPAIDGILGVIQQAKVDPRAWPRNPDNEEQADVATKALRYVADKNRWHKLKVDAAETFFIEGIAAVAVEGSEDGEPVFTQIPYDELIYDPHSRMADFTDAAYKGIGKWMYEGDLMRRYPLMRDEIGSAFTASTWGTEMGMDRQDKPENIIGTFWLDPKKRRIFVVELYHREDGEWMRSVFYVGGVLEQDVSPYRDDRDETACPFIFQSCLVGQDNQRAGKVRAMLSPQDEINAYGSRALHLARSRQIQVTDPNIPPEVDAATAKAEAAKPDGAIPSGWSPVPTTDLMQGMQIMTADARQALVRQAPTPAVLADASASNQSGRSRLVLQQAGMTEIARALGRFEDFENAVYRMAWMVLKQFKRDEWWFRISGDDNKKTEFGGVNLPAGPDGEPIPPEIAQMMAQQGIQPPALKNELARMDVDIEVETVPDTANLAAEQLEMIAPVIDRIASIPEYGPKKAFELWLALSAMPDKTRVKDMLEKPDEMTPEQQAQAQQQAQMAEMQQQIAMLMAQAEIRSANAKATLDEAKAVQAGAQARGTEADTVLKAAQFELGQPIDAS